MGKRKKSRRGGGSGTPQSKLAITSVGFLLAVGFVMAGLRSLDVVLLSLLTTFLGFFGFLTAIYARKKLRRQRGRLEGESAAMIGYWGNLVVFLVSLLGFCWFFAIGVMRGDFL